MTALSTQARPRVRIRHDDDPLAVPFRRGPADPARTSESRTRGADRVPAATVQGLRPCVLHVGCGTRTPGRLDPLFRGAAWREIRLDIDPAVDPDIVASIVDLSAIGDGSCDAVWCSHNLEHLCDHEVGPALSEFGRVLAPTGFALIRCPDIEAVAEIVLDHGLDHVVYHSPAGPVRASDMLYGHSPSIARGNSYMRHGTAFTQERLRRVTTAAGFAVTLTGRTPDFTVWAAAFKADADVDRIHRALARRHLNLSALPASHA